MKMLVFECKKLFRASGFKKLSLGILAFCFLWIFFSEIPITEPQKQQDHISNYSDNISYAIRIAERNRIDYGYTAGNESYIVKYQEDIISIYSNLLEKGIAPKPVVGWDEYFSYTADDLCLFIFAVLVGVILSMTEYDNRTDSLARITPNGRKSVSRKIIVFAISAFAFSVVEMLLTLLGFAIRFGLSSPFVPICSVIEFLYCPYDITIFEYLILSLLIKSLNILLLMLISAFNANIFKSYIPSIFSSASVIVLSFGTSSFPSNSGWIYINPYAIGITDDIFVRYRSVNLFGYSASVSVIIAAFILFSCILLSVLLAFRNRQSNSNTFFRTLEKKILHIREVAKAKIDRVHIFTQKRHSLFVSEAKKCFIKSKLIILCIIMLCVKIYFIGSELPPASSYEPHYRDICNDMAGTLTDNKRLEIRSKLEESRDIISQNERMHSDFNNGRITYEEYSAYRNKLDLALADEFAYTNLYSQCERIDIASENGIEAQLIYDTGWLYLFEKGADIILYAFLLMFFCGIYSMEYNNGFDRIARSTQKGIQALDKAKIKLAIVVTSVAFLLFFGLDIAVLSNDFPITNFNFSSASIILNSPSFPLWISLVILATAKLAIALILSCITCLLSRFLKKPYLSFAAGLLIVASLYITKL